MGGRPPPPDLYLARALSCYFFNVVIDRHHDSLDDATLGHHLSLLPLIFVVPRPFPLLLQPHPPPPPQPLRLPLPRWAKDAQAPCPHTLSPPSGNPHLLMGGCLPPPDLCYTRALSRHFFNAVANRQLDSLDDANLSRNLSLLPPTSVTPVPSPATSTTSSTSATSSTAASFPPSSSAVGRGHPRPRPRHLPTPLSVGGRPPPPELCCTCAFSHYFFNAVADH